MSPKPATTTDSRHADETPAYAVNQDEVCSVCGTPRLNTKPDRDPGWSDATVWKINGQRVCCRCFWSGSALDRK